MRNASWIIRRPVVGRYRPDVLALEDRPVRAPRVGEVLLRTLMISLDPSNLMWLKLQPGWMEEVHVGDVMKGQTLAVVEESEAEGLAPGDLVAGMTGWAARWTTAASGLTRIVQDSGTALTGFLTIYSHVGRAAMIGMEWVAGVRPGETILVSGAHGATGFLASQIALAHGCRVIGVAGGEEKCGWLRERLGIEAIDYKRDDVAAAVAALCPTGPHIYFDNVGGALLDDLLPVMAIGGRIAICGQISQYDHISPDQAYKFRNLFFLFMRRLRMQGFVVPDFAAEMPAIDERLEMLHRAGRLADRPHLLHGIDTAAAGLEMLVEGHNRGKLIVQLDVA